MYTVLRAEALIKHYYCICSVKQLTKRCPEVLKVGLKAAQYPSVNVNQKHKLSCIILNAYMYILHIFTHEHI